MEEKMKKKIYGPHLFQFEVQGAEDCHVWSYKCKSCCTRENPVRKEGPVRKEASKTVDESTVEDIDGLEIFDHIRDIKDPEHPYSLEQLNVVSEENIKVSDKLSHVEVLFTPTVQHCSMSTVIGLCIRVQLMRCLPPRFKVDIRVSPGSHASEAAVNEKERIVVALGNPHLYGLVEDCLGPTNH